MRVGDREAEEEIERREMGIRVLAALEGDGGRAEGAIERRGCALGLGRVGWAGLGAGGPGGPARKMA